MTLIYSSVLTARNFKAYPFRPKLTENQRGIVDTLLIQALKDQGIEILGTPQLLSNALCNMPQGWQPLSTHEWIHLRQKDHLVLLNVGNSLQEVARSALSWSSRLDHPALWAYEARWGYLTSQWDQIGLGWNLSALLHLPLASEDAQGFLTHLSALVPLDSIEVSGLLPQDPHFFPGGFVRLRQKRGLLVQPEIFVAHFEGAVQRLLHLEEEATGLLSSEAQQQWRDRAGKAWGMASFGLKHDPIEVAEWTSAWVVAHRLGTLSGTQSDLLSLIQWAAESLKSWLREELEEEKRKRACKLRDFLKEMQWRS